MRGQASAPQNDCSLPGAARWSGANGSGLRFLARYRTRTAVRGRTPAQALTELAFLMPLLVVVFAALIQFGLLFVVYLNVLHLTRDVGRWLVAHPDKTDQEVIAYIQANVPTGLDYANFHLDATASFPAGNTTAWPWYPNCPARSATGECVSGAANGPQDRSTGLRQRISLTYDATPHILLPTRIGSGYWELKIPWSVQQYTYYMMVEERTS
jgi:hypothetical protein